MSAFIVGADCIHRCVAAMLEPGEEPTELGRSLYRMNREAVKYRYGNGHARDAWAGHAHPAARRAARDLPPDGRRRRCRVTAPLCVTATLALA